MADLEKVVKALECCTTRRNCSGCPYFCLNARCQDDMNREALELLKGDYIQRQRETKWIKCSDKMPEEHESIFAKYKGTDKWRPAMFERTSYDVCVVSVFQDGERIVEHARTVDGKWYFENSRPLKRTVTHWMPNPVPPEED